MEKASSAARRLRHIFQRNPTAKTVSRNENLKLSPESSSPETSAGRRLRHIFRHNPTAKIVSCKENLKLSPESSSPETVDAKSARLEKFNNVVQTFKKKSSSTLFRRKDWQYRTTVERLASAGQLSHVDEILQHQKQYPDIKIEKFTARLIDHYGEAKMLDHAVNLFEEMPELNCPRSVVSFNSLLGACFPSEKYDKVLELLQELPSKLSIEPNVVSYTLAVKALCNKGSFDDAVSFLDEMAAKGVNPNAMTFDAILGDLYHCGRFAEGEKLWESMKEKAVEPDLRCYNSRIYGMLAEKRFSDAAELVKELEEKGLKPNAYTYNLFIKTFVNEGDAEEVRKWFAALEQSDDAPNIFTYILLVPFATKKIGTDFAFELCKKCVAATQNKLSKSIVMNVRDELLKNSQVEKAEELLKLFKFNTNKNKTE